MYVFMCALLKCIDGEANAESTGLSEVTQSDQPITLDDSGSLVEDDSISFHCKSGLKMCVCLLLVCMYVCVSLERYT